MSLILDLLFPKRCIGCHKFGTFLCTKCVLNLEPAVSICIYCKHPSILGLTHAKCTKKYGIDGLTVLYKYKGLTKKLIHKLKYEPYMYALTQVCAKLISSYLEKNELMHKLFQEKYLVAPIPLYWLRKHLRGYNQVELIAKELAQSLSLSYEDLLQRTKHTKPQYLLHHKERITNLKAAFQIKNNIKNLPKNILLIDDVTTTGATLTSAAKILKRRGVESVWALTFAR